MGATYFSLTIIIDFSPGSGILAAACLKNKVMYVGWAMTARHIMGLERRLRADAIRFMTDSQVKGHHNLKAQQVFGDPRQEDAKQLRTPTKGTPTKGKVQPPAETQKKKGGKTPKAVGNSEGKEVVAPPIKKAKTEAGVIADNVVENVAEEEEVEDGSDWELSPQT